MEKLAKSCLGRGLVELIVGLALSALLLLVGMTLLTKTLQARNLATINAQLNLQISTIYSLLQPYVFLAGYKPLDTKHTIGQYIFGCDGDFVKYNDNSLSCSNNGQNSSIYLSYIANQQNSFMANKIAGEVYDCTGKNVQLINNEAIVYSKFYLKDDRLYCSRDSNSRALVDNVVQFRVKYFYPGLSVYVPAKALSYQDWQKITSIKVCLVVKSSTKLTGLIKDKVNDCDDKPPPSDGYLYQTESFYLTLRNSVYAIPKSKAG